MLKSEFFDLLDFRFFFPLWVDYMGVNNFFISGVHFVMKSSLQANF